NAIFSISKLLQFHSSSSSLVFCPRAGSWHLLSPLLMSPAILFLSTYPSLFFLLFFCLVSGSLFSSLFLRNLLLDHLSSLSLVSRSASSPALSPPSYLSINHLLSAHALSNSSVIVLLL